MMKDNGNNFLDNLFMTKLKDIKHVFFDLDHTLWDFDKNSALAFAKIFEKNKIDVSLEDFLEVYKPINIKYWKYYREARVTKEQLRYGRLSNSFKGLNIEIDDFLINRLADDYITYLPQNNYLFKNVISVLESLVKSYQLHIITNGFEEVQMLKLQKSKIDSFFKTITTSESAGVKKPDPKIFYHALKAAGATAAESVMIGDSYEADVLGAKALGIEAICFNYHQTELREDDICIYDLNDLHTYL